MIALLLAGILLPAQAPEDRHILLQAKGEIKLVDVTGKTVWSVPCRYTSHDLQVLANGNFLLHTGNTTIVEMNRDKEIVWKYEAKPKPGRTGAVEIHAFQRLPDGRTMIAESGNARIVEVDAQGKIVKEIPLKVENPHPHTDTRLARKLDSGNYLVCHEADGVIREYDGAGKVVWEYRLDLAGRPASPGHGVEGHGTKVFGAVRLPSGNTLIAAGNGNRVFEVDRAGKTVWSIEQDDLPGIKLAWVTHLQVLKNGNIVFGNCHAGPDNPQIIEVTRDKKVVWSLKDWDAFGNDLAAAVILGDEVEKR